MFGKKESTPAKSTPIKPKAALSSPKKPAAVSNSNNEHTIIGESIIINGNINGKGGIRLDGSITGNIETEGKVIIGKKGILEGNLTARVADIEGTVNGIISAKEVVTLKAGCKVTGEIQSSGFSVEPGANFSLTKANTTPSATTTSSSETKEGATS